jgi:hypothetical protein
MLVYFTMSHLLLSEHCTFVTLIQVPAEKTCPVVPLLLHSSTILHTSFNHSVQHNFRNNAADWTVKQTTASTLLQKGTKENKGQFLQVVNEYS